MYNKIPVHLRDKEHIFDVNHHIGSFLLDLCNEWNTLDVDAVLKE